MVLRRRKFTTATLAQTFVFGFLSQPRASDEELAQTAGLFGVARHHPGRRAAVHPAAGGLPRGPLPQGDAVASSAPRGALAPMLERFPAVYLLDSTSESLPDAQRDRFPGCGGSHGGGQAAMKLQVRWDLRSGALQAVRSRRVATATTRRRSRRPP